MTRIAGNVNSRFAAVEARLNALEAREAKTLADSAKGPWLPGRYERGALVSHRGSAWIAVEDGDGKPGESGMWRLFVQKGRDGRDAAA